MQRLPQRAAAALFTAVVLFAASTRSQCVPYNSSYTAGHPENVSIAFPVYGGCPDGHFLVTIEASHDFLSQAITWLSWTCSSVDDTTLATTDSSGTQTSLSFTVGITQVTTKVLDSNYPYLTHMHFGGHDVDSTGTDTVFENKGPFGDSELEAVTLPETAFSWCSSGSYATGLTAWASGTYVYGVMLECAYVTTTCAPLNYPANLLEGTPAPAFSATTPFPSALPAPDPPSSSANPVSTTDPPSSSANPVATTDPPSTVSSIDTPSPLVGPSSAADTPSPSENIESTGESSSSSSASTIIVGASVAGGLFCLALGVGVTFCLYRREDRNMRRYPGKPQDTSGVPVAAVGGGGRVGGGGFAAEEGTVTHWVCVNEAESSPSNDPPPPPYSEPYTEQALHQEAPPSYSELVPN